jgi:ABC-type multidrug transport system fused ATPase/permease subunit
MSSVRKIYEMLTPSQRRQAVWILVLTIVGTLLETLGLGLVIPVLGLLTENDIAATYPQLQPLLRALGNPNPKQLIIGGMLTLLALHVVRVAFMAFLYWRQMTFAFSQYASLSQRLFTVYLRQPYTFHLNRNSAQLIQNAIGEVRMFTFNVMLPAIVVMTEGLVAVGMAALLIAIEPRGAIIVVALMVSASWVFQRSVRTMLDRAATERQLHEGLRLQHLQQGLGGAKEVLVLGREADFLAQYQEHSDHTARIGRFQLTLQQLPRLWLELLAISGLAALVLIMTMRGANVASVVPTIGLFAAAAFRLMPSANRFMGAVQSLRFGAPVVDVLHRELLLPTLEPISRRGVARPFTTAIALVDLSYTYASAAAPALRNVSIEIQKGESVGLIGPSGSGKSTLVDVILGLLKPNSGMVLADGADIHADLRDWQDQIGYVPQTIYLTDDTLRRNVAFGVRPDRIDEVAVKAAISAAQLDDLIAGLPAGLDTVVGERGVRLSGGQRQRIGIARALYHDPPVLVLDEATSALDSDTERGVMAAVYALHGAKTLLIVAHRLTSLLECDRLIRLDAGRVVAEGTPAELISALPTASTA